MDIYSNLIIVKNTDKTQSIVSCNRKGEKYEIVYNNSSTTYIYLYLDVIYITNPQKIDVSSVRISRKGNALFDIKQILQFNEYFKIFFGNGEIYLYNQKDIVIEKNGLSNKETSSILEYYKCVADKVSIQTEEGKKILYNQLEKLTFISSRSALATYLNPNSQISKTNMPSEIFFPFGCNSSQMQAVSNALSNKISVIEGPPGTGKTQTILNIIANAIINNKTVAIVSNNNSATENVYEKLKKYGFDFIAAPLGKIDNKKEFINEKQSSYPNLVEYKYESDFNALISDVVKLRVDLKEMLDNRNRISLIKSKLSEFKVEKKYFDDYFKETYDENLKIRDISKLKSTQLLDLWNRCQIFNDLNRNISFWFKLKCIFYYGIFDVNFLKKPISDIIPAFQKIYYVLKVNELEMEIRNIEEKLKAYNFNEKLFEMTNKSLAVFKNSLHKKYIVNKERPIFTAEDLWRNSVEFNNEYPVVLSTTHSLRNCLNQEHLYDYVIVDESSQVDLLTGVLTLSCAKNIVIVGDLMQLPNVIPEHVKSMIRPISQRSNINDGYKYEEHSLLSSICSVMPSVPRTMLKEHYRCHPKIIEFCNRKFYDNQLVVMTEDSNESDVIKVYKTVVGNHARGHLNQRQIDEIKQNVIPELQNGQKTIDIGIISPYRIQTEAMQTNLSSDLDISTVHKFQGREKDDIIISSVDNEITDFTDNPNMLNVAVSRAKNRLRLVVSDNENNENTNIGDLIKYIQYNNFEIVEGDLYSVFDLLYSDYTEQRKKQLSKHKRVSEYDSENLMYGLIKEVLNNNCLKKLDVVVHQPLNMLIHNPKKLTDDECKYAMNPATHLDFLIFNKLDKMPVLAIEVDGYKYHQENTKQAVRDKMKDEILKKYNIPSLRFKTTGSNENEILESKLMQILGND